MGYHLSTIPKGIVGEFSKIEEEFFEAKDASMQNDSVLMLVELSDMIGAIEEYVKKWNMSIDDLKSFSDKTKLAFKDGTRVSKQSL
jgi:hypothetical protein